MKRVAIQGFVGSFHDIAAHQYFNGEQLQLVCCATFEEVFENLAKDPTMIGMTAIENTIAGSLLQQPGVNSVRAKIIAAFLNRFGFYYTHLSEKTFMAEYRSRSIVLGKQVQVLLKDGSKTALVTDIDNNANLHVQYADGGKQVLASGEISIQLGEI